MSQSFAQIFALYKNKIRAAPLAWCAEHIERAWSSSSPSSSPWGVLSIYGYLSVTSQGIVCLMPFLVKLRFICLSLVKGLSVFCLLNIWFFLPVVCQGVVCLILSCQYMVICVWPVKGFSVFWPCLVNLWFICLRPVKGMSALWPVLSIYGLSVCDLSRGCLSCLALSCQYMVYLSVTCQGVVSVLMWYFQHVSFLMGFSIIIETTCPVIQHLNI